MKVNLDELQSTSDDFLHASKDIDAIILKLSKSVKKLQDSWVDSSQQRFYQYYKEWHQHMGGVSEVLHTISDELQAIAERYADAD